MTTATLLRGTAVDERLVQSLYLDPETWLPFAKTITGVPTANNPMRSREQGRVRSTFVKTKTLPRSFFTAASIDAWVMSQES